MNTLRNRYNHSERTLAAKYSKSRSLQEKLQRIDEMVIAETNGQVLLEVLNKDDLKQATTVLKKLGTIAKIADEGKAYALSSIIKQAAKDVNEYTGGGMMALIKKGLSAVTQKMGLPVGENPIVKSVTLLNSLETGLAQLEDLISNNAPDFVLKKEKKKSVQQATAGAGDRESWDNLLKAAKKAFRPEGFFATLKSVFKGGGIPYMEDVDTTVTEILNMPAPVLLKMMQAAAGGTSTEKIAANVKDMVDASGKAKTGEPEQANEPVTDTDQLAQVLATHSKDPEAAAETAEKQPKKLIQGFVDDIAAKSNVDPGKVQKILGVLLKNKKLKGGVAEGRRISLTMDDVVDAQMALLESRGSVRRWASLLVEETKTIVQLKGVVKAKLTGNKPTVDSVAAAINAEKESYDALSDKDKKKFLRQLIGDFGLKGDSKDFAKRLIEKLNSGGDEASAGDDKNDKKSDAAEAIKDSNATAQKAVEDNDNIRFRASLLKNKLAELKEAQKILNAAKREDGYDGVKKSLEKAVEYLNKKIKGGDDALKDEADVLKTLGSSDRALLALEKFLRDADRKSASREDSAKSKELQALQDRLTAAAEESKKAIEQAGSEKGELEGKLKGKEDEIAKLANGLKENEKVLDALAKKLNIDSGKLKKAAEGNPSELEAFVTSLFEKKPEVAAAAVKAVKSSPSSGDGKHAKLLKSIENDIADLDAESVSAVLDAIPSWMLAESRRRNTLAERVKLRRRDVM